MTQSAFWLTPAQEPPLIAEPRLFAETSSYLVVYKPPRMHTAPLKEGEEKTLLAWTASLFPDVLRVHGYKAIEGGLLHRLDHETQGLTLFARTDAAMAALAAQQENNMFVKEYDAVSAISEPRQSAGYCSPPSNQLPGFPPYPLTLYPHAGNCIESAFRPYGKGRKAVRPLIDAGFPGEKSCYSTGILSCTNEGDKQYFRLRITKGFRHQIRCHLAWIKRPILNDTLYGGNCDGGFLALRASALAFTDPESGEAREYRVPE